MKRTIVISMLAALLAVGSASAQEERMDRQQQHKARLEKRALEQAKDLKLDEGTTVWFVNLFVEYQTELEQARRAAMKDAPRRQRENNSEADEGVKDKELKKLSEEDAEKLIQGTFDRTERELRIKQSYYPRFREKLSAKQLVRLFVPAPNRGKGWNQGQQQGFGGPFGGHFGPPNGGRRF